MSEDLLIHMCVQIFMKIKDLNIHFENKFNFDNSHYNHLNIPLHNLSAYYLNKNDDLHYVCIILQNVKRSPNPNLCSNFQENKRLYTYACNCLITSPDQFIVMCQLFGNRLKVGSHYERLFQRWPAFETSYK